MYVADLHIHSRFSRACSQQLNIPNLVEWAKLKGLDLLGTGDFLHPLWLTELKANLKEDGTGFMQHNSSDIKFVLSVEISSIYSHKGRVRRVHNLVLLPSFEAADKFQKALLARHATLASDGRPIVGISSKDLLAMALEADEKALFIPAHIWTPWFGVFGSESGYDSLKDCFEDLENKIYAIETGLSSDPAMNWRVAELDDRSILSFSDAHSLPNLGREATVVDGEFSYDGLWRAMKKTTDYRLPTTAEDGSQKTEDKIAGTIEFYPEEGKYHYTGHRNCEVKLNPDEEIKNGIICPKCRRGLTVGVMSRVEKLATRGAQEVVSNRPKYRMLVPLNQIIAEALKVAKTSQKVLNEYKKLATNLGGEIKVLTKVDLAEIGRLVGPKIAEGVDRMRQGKLVIDPGYDGVYGVVKIWPDGEQISAAPQLGLFE
ncbi:DNA helicase UvrD [Candidatus Daviesbacteria bacterium]|nr:DNA helicase UvrD [Candidatus Daviesbacteria bacterium]MBI3109413.1 DNA helicase UvrD [Candidatus Daviesbacteria bacterium]